MMTKDDDDMMMVLMANLDIRNMKNSWGSLLPGKARYVRRSWPAVGVMVIMMVMMMMTTVIVISEMENAYKIARTQILDQKNSTKNA